MSSKDLHNSRQHYSEPSFAPGNSYGSTGRQVWNPLGTNYGAFDYLDVEETPDRTPERAALPPAGLGLKFRDERLRRGVQVNCVSQQTGIHPNSLRKFERRRAPMEVRTLEKILSLAESWGITV